MSSFEFIMTRNCSQHGKQYQSSTINTSDLFTWKCLRSIPPEADCYSLSFGFRVDCSSSSLQRTGSRHKLRVATFSILNLLRSTNSIHDEIRIRYFTEKQYAPFEMITKRRLAANPLCCAGTCDGLVKVDGVWTVTDATFQTHDLQDVVDCAKNRDVILLKTTKMIQPHDRIKVGKKITFRGSVEGDRKVNLTCPEGQGLLLFKRVGQCVDVSTLLML